MKTGPKPRPLLQRLWAHTQVNLTTGCWEWTGCKSPAGYGYIGFNKRTQAVHRVGFVAYRGPITSPVLDHLCRNRGCWNPWHLEPTTPKENNRRGAGFSGRNAQRTHCAQGHPFTGHNVYVTARGHRACRQCNANAHRRQAIRVGKPLRPAASQRTHCPAGHPYDETNTGRATAAGGRRCRACHREQERQRYARTRRRV